MGAPAIATTPRRTRPQPKPRPAAKPRMRTAAKQRARATQRSARPVAKPRPRKAAAAAKRRKPEASVQRRRPAATARSRKPAGSVRTTSRPRAAVAGAGGVVMFPVAAVGGIADSSLIERLTRGRSWIVLLGVLLGGIVAINVFGLGLSASSSTTEARIDALQSDNGVLRARNAKLLSTEEIQRKAAELGLAIPAPDAIHYLDSAGSDAAKAAKRLASGEIVAGDPVVEGSETDDALADSVAPPATTDPSTVPTTDPAATTPATTPTQPIDPNTGLPAVDPATGAPVTVDPVTGATISP